MKQRKIWYEHKCCCGASIELDAIGHFETMILNIWRKRYEPNHGWKGANTPFEINVTCPNCSKKHVFHAYPELNIYDEKGHGLARGKVEDN